MRRQCEKIRIFMKVKLLKEKSNLPQFHKKNSRIVYYFSERAS